MPLFISLLIDPKSDDVTKTRSPLTEDPIPAKHDEKCPRDKNQYLIAIWG